MNSSEHKYFFLTNNYSQLFTSFKRYFLYILQKDLKEFSKTDINPRTSLLLILSEEKEDADIVGVLANITNNKAVLLNWDNSKGINLRNLSGLKTTLGKIIEHPDSIDITVFDKEELIKKLGNLFKTHGEISIFSVLSKAQYCILNIDYFKQGNVSPEDFFEQFILPASDSWKLFSDRFKKYENYLLLLGCSVQLSKIKSTLGNIDSLIKLLTQAFKNQTMHHISSEKVNEALAFIEQIDNILTTISTQFEIGDAPIYNTGR